MDTLRGFGLPTEAVEEADSVLAPDACSWVLGLEFQKNQSLRATVYIEEIAEYLSRETLARLLETIRSRNGLPQVSLPSVGTPYILALDIHPEGARHLKLYSFIDAHTPANLGLKAPEFLFEPSAPRLLQNRSGCNGQKIYRCYPYLQTDTPEAWVDWATAAGQFNLDPSPFGRMPITSIGARFVDSDVKALSLYGCVVRPKG